MTVLPRTTLFPKSATTRNVLQGTLTDHRMITSHKPSMQDSFTTEVASSTRRMEQFKFRSRKASKVRRYSALARLPSGNRRNSAYSAVAEGPLLHTQDPSLGATKVTKLHDDAGEDADTEATTPDYDTVSAAPNSHICKLMDVPPQIDPTPSRKRGIGTNDLHSSARQSRHIDIRHSTHPCSDMGARDGLQSSRRGASSCFDTPCRKRTKTNAQHVSGDRSYHSQADLTPTHDTSPQGISPDLYKNVKSVDQVDAHRQDHENIRPSLESLNDVYSAPPIAELRQTSQALDNIPPPLIHQEKRDPWVHEGKRSDALYLNATPLPGDRT